MCLCTLLSILVITIDLHRVFLPVFRNEIQIWAKCCQFPEVVKDLAIVNFKTKQQHYAMRREKYCMLPIKNHIMTRTFHNKYSANRPQVHWNCISSFQTVKNSSARHYLFILVTSREALDHILQDIHGTSQKTRSITKLLTIGIFFDLVYFLSLEIYKISIIDIF